MTYDQIRTKIYNLTGTNVNSLTNANLNVFTQPAEDRIAALILQSDGRWEWDDTNRTDLPIGTTTITSGQQDYSIPAAQITVLRVELQNSDSKWSQLRPFDQEDEIRGALSQRDLDESGVPDEYNIIGKSIFLYPVPDYTKSASLKVYFKRGPLKFDFTDDKFTDDTGSSSSVPGFNSLFHDLIALWASYEYGISKSLKNTALIFAEVDRKEKQLIEHYTVRHKDDVNLITTERINYT